MKKSFFFSLMICSAVMALAFPVHAQESGIKKFFHMGGNEGGAPVYVNPVVPQGSVMPNKIDPSLLKPYLFGAYKGGSGNKKMDDFMSSLAMLDKVNRLASDEAQSQRDSYAHAIMVKDKAATDARTARSMQLQAQQASSLAQQVNSGRSNDPLSYTQTAPPRGSSSQRTGRAPVTGYQKNAPILMPH